MKFRVKLFISTFLIVSVGFCFGGTLLIMQNFNYSLNARINHALAEHTTIKYFYETQLIDSILQGHRMSNELLTLAADGVAERLFWSDISLFVSDHNRNLVFSNSVKAEHLDVSGTLHEQPHYKIVESQDRYYLIVSSISNLLGTNYYVTSVFDITAVYTGFAYQTRNMILTNATILAVLAVALYVLSAGLTRPISKLSEATKQIASRSYSERVTVRGNDEVAALSRQFNKMSDSVEQNIMRLEDYAKSRDDFVANFSHELKTPMTSIIGYADLLRTRKNDESIIEEAAGFIFSEGKRLETLSYRLLTLMKLRQSKLQLTANDLDPILSEVINSTRPACSKKDISVTLSSHPKQADFDPALLEMLLINLIHNACEACSDGGNIRIDFDEQGSRLYVSVTDDGCGIPESELVKISDEFYRVDKSRKHTDGNFGLGLSICKEIARLHGSELLIKSEPSKGTTVSFYLDCGPGRTETAPCCSAMQPGVEV